jgi:nitrite reductase/ring-hydroxylating ferredoxin subunit
VILAVRSDDPLMRRKLEGLAAEFGSTLDFGDTPAPGDSGKEVVAVVVDLERTGALEEVAVMRARLPDALLAGYLGRPDRELWLQAEQAGCDLVANRGALVATLRRRLADPHRPARRRVPLFPAADVAGRLGLVHRDPESPVGPLAVYHVKGRLHAIEDRCPHAGAVLSEGELEGLVLTCPRHGSQFDVCRGERVRGPADIGLQTFSLLEEGGQVYLLLPQTPPS